MKALIENWKNLQEKNQKEAYHPWFYHKRAQLPLANLYVHEALQSSVPVLLREKSKNKILNEHYHPFFLESLNENHKKLYRFVSEKNNESKKILIYFFMDAMEEKTEEALLTLKKIFERYDSSYFFECFFPVEANRTHKSFIDFFEKVKQILKERKPRFITNSEFMTMGTRLQDYLFFDLSFASRLYDAWIYHYALGYGAYFPQLELTPDPEKYICTDLFQLSPYHGLELYELR